MQTTLKAVLIFITFIYIICILKAVKKKKMRMNYLIFWMIIGIILIVALFIPDFVENVSKLIGFEMPINMIFSMAIFIILYLIFNLTILISKEENKNTILIQEVSILKKRVEELEKKAYKERRSENND